MATSPLSKLQLDKLQLDKLQLDILQLGAVERVVAAMGDFSRRRYRGETENAA
ncbi:hypothetical protein [Aureliella helgolandensis]|uniref:hypothetical protein n=1 Tax=Aureliella helgolandensis TaxID=2527968 RepID=UPI0018D0DA46|nr:hypothetical protein [Aureliella helgolandensis]